ncbi:twin-arginine translocation signal domain-containing protein [Arvimicrobium flavum]|uniref:twin-arginine translocation signal domain-containing protein n=1 Tax=Arvimicrobium flavum TaxID=3393320 RepID=UPI00237A33FF|nr:twin-arginine translocation signal domain-containing protein [Mesorhizobium shangrilense]
MQTITPPRPDGQVSAKPDVTRRSFLGALAAAPALVALPAATAASEASPLDRATYHLEQFRLAMQEHTGTPWVTRMSVKIGAAFATEVG